MVQASEEKHIQIVRIRHLQRNTLLYMAGKEQSKIQGIERNRKNPISKYSRGGKDTSDPYPLKIVVDSLARDVFVAR